MVATCEHIEITLLTFMQLQQGNQINYLVENFSRKVNTKDYVKGTWQTRNSGLLYILWNNF